MSSSAGNDPGAPTLEEFSRPKKFTIQGVFPSFWLSKVNHFGWVVGFPPSPLPPHWVKVPASGRQVQITASPHAALTLCISFRKPIQSKSRCSRTGFAANRGKNIVALPSTFKHWEAAAVILPCKQTQRSHWPHKWELKRSFPAVHLHWSTWAIPTDTHHPALLSQLSLPSCTEGSCAGTQHTTNPTNAQDYRNISGARHDVKLG